MATMNEGNGSFMTTCAIPYAKAVAKYITDNKRWYKKAVRDQGEYMAYEIFFDNYADNARKVMMNVAKANGWEEEASDFFDNVFDALEEGVIAGRGWDSDDEEEEPRYMVPQKGIKLVNMTKDQMYGRLKGMMDGYFRV